MTGRDVLALSGLVLGAALNVVAHAQENPTTPAQALAKEALNPFAEFVKLPIQLTTGFGVGPRHHTSQSINVQPEVPVSLSADWDLIFRPSVTTTYLPSPAAEFGLDDVQLSLFLTPAGATRSIWASDRSCRPRRPPPISWEPGDGRLAPREPWSIRMVRGSPPSSPTTSPRSPGTDTAVAST